MYNNDNNDVGSHISALFSPSFGYSDQRINNYQAGLEAVGLPRYMLGSELDDDGGYNNGLYGHSTLPFDQTDDYEGDAKLHNNDDLGFITMRTDKSGWTGRGAMRYAGGTKGFDMKTGKVTHRPGTVGYPAGVRPSAGGKAITGLWLGPVEGDPTRGSDRPQQPRRTGIYIGTGLAKQQALLDIKYGRETEFTKKYYAREYEKPYWKVTKPYWKTEVDKENGYGRGGRWGTGAGGRWGFGNRAAETVQAPSTTVVYPRPDRPQRRPTRGARPFAFGGRGIGIFGWLKRLFAARQEQVPVRRGLPNLPVEEESLVY